MARTTTLTRPGYRTERKYYNGKLTNETSVSTVTHSEVFSRSDIVKTPGWDRAKNKEGKWYDPRPYSWSFRVDSSTPGIIAENEDRYGYRDVKEGCLHNEGPSFMGSNLPFRRAALDDKALLRHRAEIKALLKLKDQKINLAQAFAERQQVVNLVGTSAQKIVEALRWLKRGNFKRAAKALGVTAPPKKSIKRHATDRMTNEWLALQYGWKPLLSDIYGGAEALAEKDLAMPDRYIITVKASAKSEEEYEDKKDGGTLSTTYTNTRQVSQGRIDLSVRCSLSYVQDNALLSELAALGLTNPALLAWELMPWSFVIDWFLPIGNWISAIDASIGFNFKGGHHTTLEKSNVTRFFSTRPWKIGDGTKRPIFEKIWWTETDTIKAGNREVYLVAPFPTLHLKNPLSTTHALNALALLNGLRR